jgi:hypothetical protein
MKIDWFTSNLIAACAYMVARGFWHMFMLLRLLK